VSPSTSLGDVIRRPGDERSIETTAAVGLHRRLQHRELLRLSVRLLEDVKGWGTPAFGDVEPIA